MHLLEVDARLVAVVDAGEHHPRAGAVEQRDRHRLVPGELVVGVVAHQRAMGDRAAQTRLHASQPLLQALRHLPDVLPQILEAPLYRRRVGHHVALPLAQHDLLRAAQPAQAERQRHASQQRDHGDRGSRDSDDSLGVGQVGGAHADKLSREREQPHQRHPSHRRAALERARGLGAPDPYPLNTARKVPLLFSRLVSPGTGCT